MPQASAAGAAKDPATNWVQKLLSDVLDQLNVDRALLNVARQRRNAVTSAAARFNGALRVFSSGSVAHGTVIHLVEDADAGVVLDRRSFPDLGPDGKGIGPNAIVKEMAAFIYARLKDDYPGLRYEIGRRAIKFTFSDPVKGQDPYVDLIVGLTRVNAEGLWIPRLWDGSWDASHPEEHTRQLTSESIARDLRVHRAQEIRLGKGCMKQDDQPVLSSFHVEARALRDLEKVRSRGMSLKRLFRKAAEELAEGDTPDPAGVSDPIKLEVPRDRAVRRLRGLADAMAEALEHRHDEEWVRAALSRVFPEYIDPPKGTGKDALAAELRRGRSGAAITGAFGPTAASLKPRRSSGDASSE